MALRSMTARADSIRAIIRTGLGDGVVLECRAGSVCRRTSVMKCRSEGEFTFGITKASRFGALSYSDISVSFDIFLVYDLDS